MANLLQAGLDLDLLVYNVRVRNKGDIYRSEWLAVS